MTHSENHTKATARIRGILQRPQGRSRQGDEDSNGTGGMNLGRHMEADRQEKISKENSADKQHRGKAINKRVPKGTSSGSSKEGKE